MRLIYHKRLFENAEDRRVTGYIYTRNDNRKAYVPRSQNRPALVCSPVSDNRLALRVPQVPTLSFKLLSESRWVNPIPSNPTQQAFVKCRLLLGLFSRKQNCAGMIERERESFDLVRECAKIVRRKLSRINQNLCVFLAIVVVVLSE